MRQLKTIARLATLGHNLDGFEFAENSANVFEIDIFKSPLANHRDGGHRDP